MQGAVPVFADIDPWTGNLTPDAIRARLTPRTKAVMPVHWGGYPCDMDDINALATEQGLAVVEDAAHALGATYRGRPVGALSRFTAFSFQAIKHLTTGNGGALFGTKSMPARRMSNAGLASTAARPSILGEREYDISALGYKYHLNDLSAALGLGNLEDFAPRLQRRQQIAAGYRAQLGQVAGLELLRAEPDRTHACWLFTVRVERREDFIRMLAGKNIPASVVHLRIDHNQVFGGWPDLPGQAEFNARQVSIPVHEGLRDEDVDHIATAVRWAGKAYWLVGAPAIIVQDQYENSLVTGGLVTSGQCWYRNCFRPATSCACWIT